MVMILLLTETADSEERREAREGVDRASCARSICTSRGYLLEWESGDGRRETREPETGNMFYGSFESAVSTGASGPSVRLNESELAVCATRVPRNTQRCTGPRDAFLGRAAAPRPVPPRSARPRGIFQTSSVRTPVAADFTRTTSNYRAYRKPYLRLMSTCSPTSP